MNTIILATDGSLHSDAAARFLVESPLLNRDFVVHVVHCEPDVAGDVKSFIGKADIDAWHHEESGKAMQSVVGILTAAHVGHECHELVGFTPEKNCRVCKADRCRGDRDRLASSQPVDQRHPRLGQRADPGALALSGDAGLRRRRVSERRPV